MHSLIIRFIPRGSAVLAATTLGSYVLGLLRDRTFAHTFGAGTALDSYNAAFLIPDFAFNFLVASGIAAAVVPLFTAVNRTNQHQAQVYLNSMMTLAITIMATSGVIVFAAAPSLSHVVAPGITGDDQVLITRLMRILAISPVLFAASNALGAMLVAQQRFFWYGVSPIMYNIGIIGGTLVLFPRFGIMGVAYGTVIGALLHLVVRVADALWSGWRPYPFIQFPVPQLESTLRLMGPKMIGHPVEMLTFWIFTSIASLLAAGSITALNFARNFQSVPVSVLGITMATAVFPLLAQAALDSPEKLRAVLRRAAISIGVASTLAAVTMFIIARPLVAILLGGGKFNEPAIDLTAIVLSVFCLSIPTESLSHVYARAFYATKNTAIPVALSVVSLLVAGSSAYVFSKSLGIIGLPLGFFLGSAAKTIGLFVLFNHRLTRD